MADSRDQWGEYGGKPGSIQKAEDGHELLTARERARVVRTQGIRNNTAPSENPEDIVVDGGIDVATGEKWEDAHQRRRKLSLEESRVRLNGRTLGETE